MDILKNFQISNYYKYLLYLAGILLILSFSINIKVISNLKLIGISLVTILYGVSCWIYEGNMKTRCDNINIAWQYTSSDNDYIRKEKEFKEKYNPISLSKKYERTRVIMFIVYIILLILSVVFIDSY